MSKYSEQELIQFEALMRTSLPSYIRTHVEYSDAADSLHASLIFPDDSQVSYVYQMKPDTVLDLGLANHVVLAIINISITSISAHLKLLESMKENLLRED